MNSQLLNAQGCLMGQLVGDALGSIVEFMHDTSIAIEYPGGVTDLIASPVWHTMPGQPTDDSEMALTLARGIVEKEQYDQSYTRQLYEEWIDSKPFDFGNTTINGIQGSPIFESQANGALMRVSPIGIFGSNHKLEDVADWAIADAEITHPNKICTEINALYAMAISYAISNDVTAVQVYDKIVEWATDRNSDIIIRNCINNAVLYANDDYYKQMGWVLIAFQNALYQLTHAVNIEVAIIDTVSRGGDTDTNGAICGALLGAVYGIDSIPKRWTDVILACKSTKDAPTKYPRPSIYWPHDALELANDLIANNYKGQ